MLYMSCLIFLLIVTARCSVRFDFTNNEGGPIWVGIQGNSGKPPLMNGGFVLNQGTTITVQADDNWAGRFWPRSWCNSATQHCQTGDCGNRLQCGGNGGVPPATLVEITLKGSGGLDFYDISLVDGFNIRARIQPISGQGDGSRYSCALAGCTAFINDRCPNELKLIGGNGNDVIGCKSACLAFNTDQYCCRGAFNTPSTCKSSEWPTNYPAFFKQQCPDAYSYAYDDHKSTFTCKASHYIVTFG